MLIMKDIIREGHPTLRKKAAEVSLPASEEEQEILSSMLDYVINSQDPDKAKEFGLRPGVGLAAPQINVSKRMIAVHVKDSEGKQYSYALFNPKIIRHTKAQTYLTNGEGCLSVDRPFPGFVPRYAKITVKGVNLNGEEISVKLTGLPAIVFQHEIDHLNGIMFFDRINEIDPFDISDDATPLER